MFASSGNEIKIWDIESNEIVSEYHVPNRTGSFGPIHSFVVKSDSRYSFFYSTKNSLLCQQMLI